MKRVLKLSLMLIAAAISATGCSCYKKMVDNIDTLGVVCSPEVLTLNNGAVRAEIVMSIPARYFDKRAVLRITPVLVFQGGEAKSDPIMLQGEHVLGNNQSVNFEESATIKSVVSFAYAPEMRRSRLQLRIEMLCNCNECAKFVLIDPRTTAPITMSELEALESDPSSDAAQSILRRCGLNIADGINTLQLDFDLAQMMKPMKDGYKRVESSTESFDLSYRINSSVVDIKRDDRSGLSAFSSMFAENTGSDRVKQSLSINGYASPDGEESFNEALSMARAKSAKRVVVKSLGEYGVGELDVKAYGEDWDGFIKLIEESDIEDKGLILQILAQYETASQRERELRNLSNIFAQLKRDVFPKLRRAQVVNNIENVGKSDEEMLSCVATKQYVDLTADESLYICANLDVDHMTQILLLDFAAKSYGDYRAYNNLGVLYAQMGRVQEAKDAFDAAINNGAKRADISDNMLLLSLETGDIEQAKQLVDSSTDEVKCMMAAVSGDYTQVGAQMTGYNAAVAYAIMGNYTSAKLSLGDMSSSDAEYLRAVISSLAGDLKSAAESLTRAVKSDEELAKKAASDVNLKNLFDSGFRL